MPTQVPGDFMQRFAGVPVPTYVQEEARLVAYYKQAFTEITGQLVQMGGGLAQERAVSLLRQIEFILRQLDQDVQAWCNETVSEAFKHGQAYTLVALGDAATLAEAASVAQFSMLARNTVEALVNDTYSDLLVATQFMERQVKNIVRDTVAKTLRLHAVQQHGRITTTKALHEELSAKFLQERLRSGGWVGIVDKSGRKWNLTTYSEMVVRSKVNQAWVEGVRVETLARDDGNGKPVDLATISRHGAEDACRHFEGLVISIHGLTNGYVTYDELRASQLIFHPNCKHKLRPLRSFDLLTPEQQALHQAKNQEARKALATGRR